ISAAVDDDNVAGAYQGRHIMKQGGIGVRNAQGYRRAGDALVREDRAKRRIEETRMQHVSDGRGLALFEQFDCLGGKLRRQGTDVEHCWHLHRTWWVATGRLSRTFCR